MIKLTISLFVLSTAIAVVLSNQQQAKENACSNNYNFDYLLLATQWPGSFCFNQKCPSYAKQRWSIHGGWPNYQSGGWPSDCCFEKDFNATKLKSIRDKLQENWVTLQVSSFKFFKLQSTFSFIHQQGVPISVNKLISQ